MPRNTRHTRRPLFVAVALLCAASHLADPCAAAEPLRVGVFDAHQRRTTGRRVVTALKDAEGIDLRIFGRIDDLHLYQVVVFPGTNDAGTQSPTWRDQIVVYVGDGGGVVLSYFACGFPRSKAWWGTNRSQMCCLFPDVLSIVGLSGMESLSIGAPAHPVLAGVQDLAAFQNTQGYRLAAGPRGTALVTGEGGAPAWLVAGSMGSGKVIGFGGPLCMGTKSSEVERALLLKAIKWAAVPVRESTPIPKDDELHILRSEVRILKEKVEQGQRGLRNRMNLMESTAGGQ